MACFDLILKSFHYVFYSFSEEIFHGLLEFKLIAFFDDVFKENFEIC